MITCGILVRRNSFTAPFAIPDLSLTLSSPPPVGGPEATLPYPSPQMAAIGYANSTSDPGAVNNFLVVTLDSHGTLLTNHWDTNSWTTDLAPSLTGTSEDVFERIAMVAAEDLVLYGLTAEGAIKAFLIDRGDTSTWAFDSVVVAGSPS